MHVYTSRGTKPLSNKDAKGNLLSRYMNKLKSA